MVLSNSRISSIAKFDLVVVRLQKDSCSRGVINKRTRAGLQQKVKQSFAFPPQRELLPPFWRVIVQHDRVIRFNLALV